MQVIAASRLTPASSSGWIQHTCKVTGSICNAEVKASNRQEESSSPCDSLLCSALRSFWVCSAFPYRACVSLSVIFITVPNSFRTIFWNITFLCFLRRCPVATNPSRVLARRSGPIYFYWLQLELFAVHQRTCAAQSSMREAPYVSRDVGLQQTARRSEQRLMRT